MKYILLAPLFLLLTLGGLPASAIPATTNPNNITFILPARVLHQSLKQMLPLPFPTRSPQFRGTVTIDSIDKLRIHDNMVTLHGLVSGKNLVMNTSIGGRSLKIKLGSVRLPVSCDLRLRLDPVHNRIMVRPSFAQPGSREDAKSTAAILPLLTSAGDHEYPLDLGRLQGWNTKIGSTTVALKMKPVHLSATNNRLVVQLRPETRRYR